MDEIMGLEGVGDSALHIILSKLEPKSTAVISCVSKKFSDLASDDSLWYKFCSDDLDLRVPVDPYGNPTPSFKVRASAVFVPEFSDLEAESDKYLFCYSIRMCLLPKGGIINGMSFSSCQLNWRHWIIRANDVIVSDVNGEAVIGKFPLLHPGQKEFVYESCTPIESSLGSIEGAFTFVPGSLEDPKGGPFQVEVARFPLQLPDYVF